MRHAIRKYGKASFFKEVLYVSFSEEDLAQAEKAIIAAYDAVNDPGFYNMSHGGKGITLRGEQHPRYGKPIPEGHRRALATASRFSGHTHTEDAKRRISAKNSGAGNFFFGKRHSEETKAIISQKAKERRKNGHPWIGRKHEADSIARMTENQPHIVPLQYEGVMYASINDMGKWLGFSHCKVRRMLRDGLIQIRKGEMPYKDVADMLETGLDRLEECAKASILPDQGDHAAAEALVLNAYRGQVADRPTDTYRL